MGGKEGFSLAKQKGDPLLQYSSERRPFTIRCVVYHHPRSYYLNETSLFSLRAI